MISVSVKTRVPVDRTVTPRAVRRRAARAARCGRTPSKASLATESMYTVWSDAVYAFIWPPWSRMKRSYSDSSGYLAVPRKSW